MKEKMRDILNNEGGAFGRLNNMQFEQTETFKNLARSFAGESQAGMRYQLTAKLAMQEKLKTLSDAIKTIAKNETIIQTFTPRDFPEDSKLSNFSIQYSVISSTDEVALCKNVTIVDAQYGNDYKYFLHGNSENGFIVEG